MRCVPRRRKGAAWCTPGVDEAGMRDECCAERQKFETRTNRKCDRTKEQSDRLRSREAAAARRSDQCFARRRHSAEWREALSRVLQSARVDMQLAGEAHRS
eukprot:5513772-Prymnesium_polylepis.1